MMALSVPAAEAIVWAACHPEREFLVGGSTVLAVEGNQVAPALDALVEHAVRAMVSLKSG